MKLLCITHADFETPGVIESWSLEKQFSFEVKKPYRGESLPVMDPYDCLIMMGGPQSPLKLEEFPYLKDEIALTKQAIAQNKRILGFCLGAQLIGEALGATTMRSPEKEIGVYPITLTTAGQKDPLFKSLPKTFPVIHWHNDMPGLTKESEVLAYSEGCPQQIVRYSPLIYGFQCHLEIPLAGIETMIQAVPEDLAPSKFTQNKPTLLAQDYQTINLMMMDLLDKFFVLG